MDYFQNTYNLQGEICELTLLPGSVLIGKTLREIEELLPSSSVIIARKSEQEYFCPPLRRSTVTEGDHLAILGLFEDIEGFAKEYQLIAQKELEHFYEDGKEVISFNNEHELLDKVHFYSRNKKSGEIIAQAGYERAIKDHTWESRFSDLFVYLKKDFNF